ncbi:MAG TPA: hypothetical protein VEQ42_05090 [Pyrinomonadaceae bacterium]|nr:hypothetical protein [Pyrinomonadaceae bacterium]
MNEREATDERAAADEPGADEGPPPFGGSWARLYALVLGNLVLLIVLFYVFTKAFA